MAILTRTLGGTGADVTILGYGAMELRGQPRGPGIADEDAGRLLTTIVGTSNVVHLASNIAIAERGPLPADLYEEARKCLPLPEAR
jgi:aryl-alcohol dehydrogenase-like predicted oxidoreductase